MNVIEIIKKQLEPLLQNTYVMSERQMTSDLEYLICDTLLELNIGDEITVIQKTNIRSFEDLEIKHGDKLYKIDINSRNVDEVISLPSLMSIKRAKDFLIDYNNFILYIFVDYKLTDNDTNIVKISVQPIESLEWEYLSIQNLGRGQLQMKNVSKELTFNNDISRRDWLKLLTIKGSEYYSNLILKITEYKSKWEEE